MNRLAGEKSPYLLQHAHNPVDWYPWGPEAFERARRENKPILLSIGYATCHWCHVMERESFENPATAALMNRYFVCIKLDREERPDVDKIYMTAVSAMTGSGGWPLNVFLTPELRPFLGGTYFPPEDRWGRVGWPRLIERLGTAWMDPLERARLTEAGNKMVSALETYLTGSPAPGSFTEEHLREGVAALAEEFDAERGGFGRAPKFPMPVNQTFLLEAHRYARRTGDGAPWGEQARDMALTTLRAMARGGLFDVLGGGFHRYSTDERWHLPHFEKMLYDNAPLAVNYLDAFALTGDPALADTARATLDYLRRDLRHPEGGFYSAEDADSLAPGSSVKAEGAFYVWTQDEIDQALGAEAPFFSEAHGVRPEGNVAEDPHGEFLEKNVLFLPPYGDGKETATERAARWTASRRKLFDIRSRRPRPFLDDKILTGWNGLALSAFSRGYGVLGDAVYLDTARAAARFLKNNLWAGTEGHRRWREGEAALPALATDHAFLAQGLVDLHQVCFDPALLEWAESILETFLKTFVDDQGGVRVAPLGGDRIVAALEREDNVEPSAASVAAGALARVSALLDRPDFLTAAEKILGALAGPAREHPRMFANALAVGAALLSGPRHVLLVGAGDRPATPEFLRLLRRHVSTSLTVFWVDSPETHARWAPRLWSVGQAPWNPETTRAYLCENRACRPPTEDPRVLERTLQNC